MNHRILFKKITDYGNTDFNNIRKLLKQLFNFSLLKIMTVIILISKDCHVCEIFQPRFLSTML